MTRSFMESMAAAVLLAVLAASANAAALYNVIDLGEGTARSVNNRGQVVGDSRANGATLFDITGSGDHIALGGMTAYSINDNGQVVGYGESGPLVLHAMLFDPTGQGANVDLDPSFARMSRARSINIHGQIVGDSAGAVFFDPTGNGNNLYLGAGSARSINDNGQIVGENLLHAILFDSTGQQNNISLGTLGGDFSSALSISNSGQIVGSASTGAGKVRHAALFDPSGAGNNIDLGTVGTLDSEALCVNNIGQVVGTVYQGWLGVAAYAALFDITGQGNNILLNTLIDPASGWNLTMATAINDHGWIVGSGVNPQGNQHAFLLIPIPEPVTLVLFSLGGLLIRNERFTKKNATE